MMLIKSKLRLETNIYSKILLIKSSGNNFGFFTCILSDYVSHEISKELISLGGVKTHIGKLALK